MFHFSKSKYTALIQCPKMLWLKANRPKLAEKGPGAQDRTTKGNVVGDLAILPAMFPDDPALDYHNLEGVHNGTEAMTIFPLIKDMPPCRARNCASALVKIL